jgi:hypothetical protein
MAQVKLPQRDAELCRPILKADLFGGRELAVRGRLKSKFIERCT